MRSIHLISTQNTLRTPLSATVKSTTTQTSLFTLYDAQTYQFLVLIASPVHPTATFVILQV
jgi:hypothetical protein